MYQLKTSLGWRVSILVLAALAPFLSCLSNPWIWDDQALLGQRLTPHKDVGLMDVWLQPYWGDVGPADTYRPLSLSFILLETRVFHDAVIPYHLVSLALHVGVCLLVMLVIGQLTSPLVGWATALLFAVHSVHAEAVAMVYGQLELICAIFLLAAVGFYTRARRDEFRPVPFTIAWLCALGAACSKESGLMLPALLMLVRATWLLREGDAAKRAKEFTRGLGWDVLFLLPVVLYLLLRSHALGQLAPDPDATVTLDYTLAMRIKTVVVSLSHAVRLCVVPTGQGLYYGHLRDSVFGQPYNELLWLVASIIVLMRLRQEIDRRSFVFGAGWFLLAFLPTSNLVPTGVLVAERTLYVPSLGICFLVASLCATWLASAEFPPKVIAGVYATILVVFIISSNLLARQWQDAETLWRSTVSVHPSSPMAHFWLGRAMVERWESSGSEPTQAELAQASEAFATAFRLNPKYTPALLLGSVVAVKQGDRAEAERLLRQAVALDPSDQAAQAALDKFQDVTPPSTDAIHPK